MSRNRKNGAGGIRFGPALKALGLCLFLGSSGVGYCWQKDQIFRLNEQIKKEEQKIDQLKHANQDLTRWVAHLQSRNYIEMRIKQIDLSLVPPQPDQIVRLYDSVPAAEGGKKNRPALYATALRAQSGKN